MLFPSIFRSAFLTDWRGCDLPVHPSRMAFTRTASSMFSRQEISHLPFWRFFERTMQNCFRPLTWFGEAFFHSESFKLLNRSILSLDFLVLAPTCLRWTNLSFSFSWFSKNRYMCSICLVCLYSQNVLFPLLLILVQLQQFLSVC